MKVSEAIDQLKAGDTVWVKAKVLDFDIDAYDERLAEVTFAEEDFWLYTNDEISLSEPHAEKQEVSQEFADWVEKAMTYQVMTKEWCLKEIANMGWGDWLHDPQNGEKYPSDDHWSCEVYGNKEKHIKAIYDGYTVKPKRWVVRQGGSEVWYLQGFRNSLDGDIVKQWCSHEGCIKFTDKAKADAVATLVDGSVEEV